MQSNFFLELELFTAASEGNLDIILYRFNQRKIDINSLHDASGRGLLHYATKAGHTHLIKPLVNLGIHVNQEDQDGNTPLHYAITYGYSEAARVLIQEGANMLHPNKFEVTPLKAATFKRRTIESEMSILKSLSQNNIPAAKTTTKPPSTQSSIQPDKTRQRSCTSFRIPSDTVRQAISSAEKLIETVKEEAILAMDEIFNSARSSIRFFSSIVGIRATNHSCSNEHRNIYKGPATK